jgi:hypothetical protein
MSDVHPNGSAAGEKSLRVLCLHGYHGRAKILRGQMAPLAAALPAVIEYVYIDAPSLATGDFGWWHEGFRGWDRTLSWAIELFASQPRFDGLFGFSQGAALTGLLAAFDQSHRRATDHGWFDFAVMVGGFKIVAPNHGELFAEPLAVPSVHVMGRGDTIVPIGDSRQLAALFRQPLVLEHPGGHVIPSIPSVTGPLSRFLTARVERNAAVGTSASRSRTPAQNG